MHHGSCLCGKVRYEVSGEIEEVSMCHCKQCQKAQGSAFAAVALIRSADFRITLGAEYLKEYRATPNKVRVFCAGLGMAVALYHKLKTGEVTQARTSLSAVTNFA